MTRLKRARAFSPTDLSMHLLTCSCIGLLFSPVLSGCRRSALSDTPFTPYRTPPAKRPWTHTAQRPVEEPVSGVIGQPCPEFALLNHEGHVVRSRNLRGTWVVMNFHQRIDIPPCACHANEFTALLLRLTADNARVLGLSRYPVEDLKKLREKYGIEIELLSDPQADVMLAYGAFIPPLEGVRSASVIRTTFIIDPDGLVRAYWSGIEAEGHAEEVAARLRAFRSYEP